MSKIIFELVLQDVNAQQAIAKFRQEVKEANAEIKKGVGGDRFKELTEKVTEAKVSIFKLTEEQKKLRKEFAATQVPTDSLAGLRIAYAQVTEQVTKLTRAERESNFGKKLIKDGAGLKSQIDGIEQSLGRFTGNVGNYKSALNGITGLLGAAGIGVGVAALINFGKESIKAIDEQLKADAQIKAAIQSTAGIAGKSLSELKAQAEALQKITLFSDDQTQNAQALLLTFTNIRGEIFDRTIPVVQDLATAFNQDLGTSAKQVGKALNDPIKGVGALSKAGVQFSVEQKAMIKSLVETGDLAGAQTLILKELETQIGGSAEAAAKAGAGPFQLLALQFGEVQESVGKLLLGGLSGLLGIIGDISDAMLDLVSVPLSEELQSQQTEFQALIGVLQDTTIEEEQRTAVLKQLKAEYPDYLKFVNDDAKGQIDLAATLEFGNKLFEQRILLESTQERRTELVKERIDAEQRLTKELIRQKAIGPGGGRVIGREGTVDEGEVTAFKIQRLRSEISGLNGEIADLVKVSDETALRTTGKTIAELSAQLAGVGTSKGGGAPTGGGGGKGPKKEIDLVNGSIAFFRDQIADLQKTLDNTPPDSPLFKQLIKNIRDAENALADLQELIKTSLDPSDISTTNLPGVGGITVPVNLEVTNEDETAKQLEDFAKRTTKAGADIKAEADAAQDEIDQKKRDDVEEAIKEAALNTAQAISDGLFEIQKNRAEKEKSDALEALDAETEKKIEAAQGNAALIAKIEKDADKKREAIEKEAANRAKKIALGQAAIDTALAILKALSSAAPPFNFILAAAAAVAGAVQLAVIKKQEFARGGVAKSGTFGGKPHSAGGTRGRFDDGTEIEVEKDEDFIILNKRASAERRRLSNLNGRFGGVRFDTGGIVNKLVPQFAQGGFATDFIPQIALPGGSGQAIVVQTTAEISDAQMDMLAAKIALQTGRATKAGVGEGLEDNNRLQERQAALVTNREA